MNSAVRRAPFVPRVDRAAPLQFLRTAYDADDWIALFLRCCDTGEAVQRVGPVALFQQPTVQAWLLLIVRLRFPHSPDAEVAACSSQRKKQSPSAMCAMFVRPTLR